MHPTGILALIELADHPGERIDDRRNPFERHMNVHLRTVARNDVERDETRTEEADHELPTPKRGFEDDGTGIGRKGFRSERPIENPDDRVYLVLVQLTIPIMPPIIGDPKRNATRTGIRTEFLAAIEDALRDREDESPTPEAFHFEAA